MKHLFKFIAVAFAAQVALVSCDGLLNPSDENLDDLIEGAVTFSASINSMQTRVTGSSFDQGDEISVTAYSADSTAYAENILYSYAEDIFASTQAITLPEDGSALSYIAIYPYTAMKDGQVEFSISANQGGDNYVASDLMSSSIAATPQSSPMMSFDHLLSSVVVNITSDNALVGIDASVLSPKSVAFDIANKAVVESGDMSTITMNANGEGSFKAIVAPQSFAEGDVVATVTIAGITYNVPALEDVTLESGCQYTFNIKVEIKDDEPTSEVEVTFSDIQINEWGEGFEVDYNLRLPSLNDSMDYLYYSMVCVNMRGAESPSHCDFSYPSLMLAYEAMACNVVSVAGPSNSGYDWFGLFANGSILSYESAQTEQFWVTYRNLVFAANQVLRVVRLSGGDSAETQPYVAAAKAMRAMFYLDMARLYEPLENTHLDVTALDSLTVPYISEITTPSEQVNSPRLSRDEMFAKIFEDLDAAEQLYSEGGVEPLSSLVPDLAVVYGLKARAYLWLGGFDDANYLKAADYARKAITTSGATIMSKEQYCDIHKGFNTPNDSWLMYASQLSQNVSNLINFVAFISSEETYGYGQFVYDGITKARYDRMRDGDFRKRLFKGPDATFEEFSDVTLFDYDSYNNAFPYFGCKFRPFQGNISNYMIGNVTSIPLMRVEEMYLIEAEAEAHASATVGGALLSEFMRHRDPSYDFNSTSIDDVIDEIIFQKSIEFWGEGIYLFDAKRLGLGIHTAGDQAVEGTSYAQDIDGVAPWWNMPFPNWAVSLNPAMVNNPDPSKVSEVE